MQLSSMRYAYTQHAVLFYSNKSSPNPFAATQLSRAHNDRGSSNIPCLSMILAGSTQLLCKFLCLIQMQNLWFLDEVVKPYLYGICNLIKGTSKKEILK